MRCTIVSLLAAAAFGWDECKPFKEIFAGGKELCEVMWNDSFEYQPDEAAAFSMWFYDKVNPNNAIASSLGKDASPDQCMLQYMHKQGDDGAYEAPSPEGDAFTECHPWKDNACCHEATVATPTAMNELYGEGYHWDRCGPMSNACEQFFIQEACFYECSPHAGSYRRYTDAEVAAFTAFQAVEGNPGDPCYMDPAPKADDAKYTGTFEHDGATYPKSTFYGDGCYGPNKWQMHKMPIKASFCDAWWTACQHDLFCGDGSFFGCAADYRAEAAAAEAKALDEALAPFPAHIQAEVRASNATSANAALLAQELVDAERLPDWAVALIVVLGALGLCCAVTMTVVVGKERAGKPLFKNFKEHATNVDVKTATDVDRA